METAHRPSVIKLTNAHVAICSCGYIGKDHTGDDANSAARIDANEHLAKELRFKAARRQPQGDPTQGEILPVEPRKR